MRRLGAAGLVLVLVLSVSLAACGSGSSGEAGGTSTTTRGSSSDGPTTGDLAGHTFASREVTGRELADGATVVLAFDQHRLTVTGGCNTISGGYEVRDGTLRFTGAPASTEMACPDDARMAQDGWITELLTTGMQASLAGHELTLRTDGATLTLVERSAAVPDRPLEGTTWTLETLTTGDTASSVPGGLPPVTLVVADGRASVFTGCNRGSATAEVADDGRSVTIGPLALTRMACGPGADEVEQAVTTVLGGEVEVHIDGDALTLANGDRSLTYRAG